ncbi:MAG: exodeoxyribonuclease III [Opitutales bacterium]
MRLLSWNVNGLRAVLNKDFARQVAGFDADVLALQETKVSADVVPGLDLDAVGGQLPHHYWACADRKGYSGTALFCRTEPIAVEAGLGVKTHDGEGRVLTAEFPDFFLVNVYTPNSQNELKRLPYRQTWDKAFRSYLKKLERTKPVIFCGDLNVAHEEIDLARPRQNRMNAGFTDEERAGMTRLLQAGYLDTFRHQHPGETGHYSWWSFRGGARARNVGWRLDYFGLSRALAYRLGETFILKDITGSDHVPVGMTLD